MAFGYGLADDIRHAYVFLMDRFQPGDRVFLFGFSRGAYTARSIAGMLRKCGILRRDQLHRYAQALDLYRSDDHPDDPWPVEFREKCSVAGNELIRVRFIGVWDTVGALGIPLSALRWLTRRQHQFHDTQLSKCVQSAYHALAIDERRRPFTPTLWSYQPKEGQTVQQVWFCGAHSDVGGGYLQHGLSDIALAWMKENARAEGLVFNPSAEQAYPIRPDPRAPLHNSRKGIYRLTSGIDRPIGVDAKTGAVDVTQTIHPSVLERWDADPAYRPPSLRAHLRRQRDPRADR